jgi:hypothetical protein
VRKISPTLGFDPRTAQAVASRYTDYATIMNQSDQNILQAFQNNSAQVFKKFRGTFKAAES